MSQNKFSDQVLIRATTWVLGLPKNKRPWSYIWQWKVYLIAMRLDWTKSLPTQLKLCPASLVRTEPLKMHFFTSFCSFLKFGKKENPHDIFGTKIPISRSKAPWQLYAVI